jgi:5-methylcytosine-specific restriction endonuclease McrA
VLRRTQMRRTGRLKRTRMRRSSGKAKGLRLEKAAWRARVEELRVRAGGRCENPFCRKRGLHDPHHVVKRGQSGTDDLTNLVYLCRRCHDRTEFPKDHPLWLGVARDQDPEPDLKGFAFTINR